MLIRLFQKIIFCIAINFSFFFNYLISLCQLSVTQINYSGGGMTDVLCIDERQVSTVRRDTVQYVQCELFNNLSQYHSTTLHDCHHVEGEFYFFGSGFILELLVVILPKLNLFNTISRFLVFIFCLFLLFLVFKFHFFIFFIYFFLFSGYDKVQVHVPETKPCGRGNKIRSQSKV